MEVTVAEAPGQQATFRWPIPTDVTPDFQLDVKSFIEKGAVIPMPCPSEDKKAKCCPNCTKPDFSQQLDKIAQAIANGTIHKDNVSDLEKLL